MRFSDVKQFTKGSTYQVDVTWDHLEGTLDRYNSAQKLELDPDFQRVHVWTDVQRARYIEYILRGGQSSREIYFNQADWMTAFQEPMYLVDGKQRLFAVRSFLRDEVSVFGGYVFSNFEGRLPFTANFSFNVSTLATKAEVVQWYLDLNFGGTIHTSQERRAVHSILAKLADG